VDVAQAVSGAELPGRDELGRLAHVRGEGDAPWLVAPPDGDVQAEQGMKGRVDQEAARLKQSPGVPPQTPRKDVVLADPFQDQVPPPGESDRKREDPLLSGGDLLERDSGPVQTRRGIQQAELQIPGGPPGGVGEPQGQLQGAAGQGVARCPQLGQEANPGQSGGQDADGQQAQQGAPEEVDLHHERGHPGGGGQPEEPEDQPPRVGELFPQQHAQPAHEQAAAGRLGAGGAGTPDHGVGGIRPTISATRSSRETPE
jgi:hypothetical protein